VILICYDGSADAKAAIGQGARLMPGQKATVLTVWEPFIEIAARSTVGFGLVPSIPDAAAIDEASAKEAEERAQAGARFARDAGFDAEPHTCSQTTTTAQAILSEANALGASAILIGSRGLTGLKSLLLGSVSHAVVQHADRTVIVVPSSEVARSRDREREALVTSNGHESTNETEVV
jgi:nucleotide-binding universal stress UspA family protein